MAIFLSGFILFFLLHILTATPALRRKLAARTGENAWKGIVALVSLAGIVLICLGWSKAPNEQLFAPSALAIQLAPYVVSVALVLFVIGGGNLKGHIKHALHHPMLAGTALWSATHLLANGGWRETVLFGSFLVYSVYAYCSLMLAGKRSAFVPHWKWDVIGVAVGLFVAIGVLHSHKWLFGIAVS